MSRERLTHADARRVGGSWVPTWDKPGWGSGGRVFQLRFFWKRQLVLPASMRRQWRRPPTGSPEPHRMIAFLPFQGFIWEMSDKMRHTLRPLA